MMTALERGEKKGFAFFYKQWYAPMTGFARRWLGVREMAEDIVQDCFVVWWQHRMDTPNPAAIKAYLYTLVRNTCLNHNRNNTRRLKNERQQAYLLQDAPECAMRQMIYAETLKEVHTLVGKLPPKCREVFRLAYLKEMSNAEVAAELRITESTIRTQKARGLAILRQLMNCMVLIVIRFII